MCLAQGHNTVTPLRLEPAAPQILLKDIFAIFKICHTGMFLPASVNNRVISSLYKWFYFHETSDLRSFAKINPSRKFPNLQHMYVQNSVIIIIIIIVFIFRG